MTLPALFQSNVVPYILAPRLVNATRQQKQTEQLVTQLRDAPQQISLNDALANGYRFALCDESVTFPFQLTPELLHRAAIFAKLPVQQRPRSLFDYLHNSVAYGSSRRESNKKYSMSTEVWQHKQGVCGEMAYLYVSLARFAGLQSNYVQVFNDVSGKKVHHACAAVRTSKESPVVCVDIAYHTFDIKHKSWQSICDEQAWELFRSWR